MLRKLVVVLSVIAVGVCITVAFRGQSTAQPPTKLAQEPETVPPSNLQNQRPLKPAGTLPVNHVVLFNSGVGYFQRSGEVEGNARVDLSFSASNINDLIKSLVIEDLKGRIMPLRYDSQEPIEKTLKSFGIDLSYNPSFAQILNQARGERVELTLSTNNTGLPGTLTGMIIGMESAHRPISPASTGTTEMEFLNLSCAEGLRTVPLSQVQRLRFLNPVIEAELKRALEVVAGGHDALKKSVRIDFRGEGKREVKVGYVIENPIWKTSYRLVMTPEGKPKLIGWANVENTSDEDWNDVRLTLVSGRPISFQMDLYPPLFIPRPTVEPELFASLRPPTYNGPLTNAMNINQFGMQGGMGMANNFVPANGAVNPMGMGPGIGGGFGGQFGNLGGQMGMQGNYLNNSNRFQNPMIQNSNLNNDNNGRLSYQELQSRRGGATKNEAGQQGQAQANQKAAQLGSILTGVDPDLIEAALTAEELGNPARFNIAERVSLPRQQSAMIPILEQEIDATRVSIYNERVQAKHPLSGLRIKNQTKQALMSGPITIYDDSQYVGDARILDLQPGEERYLSYAIDTGVEVKPFDRTQPAPEMTVSVNAGQLSVQYKLRQTRSYVIKNRTPEARKVVLEQPVRDGWLLAAAVKLTQEKENWKAGDAEKPTERTRDLYRFTVDVKPGETVRYEVSEELPRVDPFAVTKQTDWSGFATTLGLDVWTDVSRKPEDNFLVQVVKDQLAVTHKDRRATTYYLRSRVNEDRTLWLEHNLAEARTLVGDAKPLAENARRFRFKVELKANQTTSHTVTDEWVEARPELYAMKLVEGTPLPRPGTDDVPQTRYVTELGFELWTRKLANPSTLQKVHVQQGQVVSVSGEREGFEYFIKNHNASERKFTLEHVVRQDWRLQGNAPAFDGAGQRYRFEVACGKGQTGKQRLEEERSVTRQEDVPAVTPERRVVLLGSPVASDAVKEHLRTAFKFIDEGSAARNKLKELRATLQEITAEQGRLKQNMEKLPTDSMLYKRFVEKLDKQETLLEQTQVQIKQATEDERRMNLALQQVLERVVR